MTPKAKASVSKPQRAVTANTNHATHHSHTSHADQRGRPRPSQLEIWKTAARPHTLTASLCPCLVSIAACSKLLPAVAVSTSLPPTTTIHSITTAWIVFCVTVQIGTNLHNDYSDFVRGADTDQRVGHARATAQGWLTPETTCRAATAVLSVTLAAGVYIAVAAQQCHNPVLWFLILSSVLNAFAYTGGPYPLGYIGLGNISIAYSGLGDVFVFLYFGWTATLMLPYLISVSSSSISMSDAGYGDGDASTTVPVPVVVNWPQLFLYATQVGLLATNIIVVNNLRDRHTDVSARKRTTSVRFGRSFSVAEYMFCLVMSYSLVLLDWYWWADCHVVRLLPLLSLPLARQEIVAIMQKDGAALNEHVGGTAKVQLLFCILLSLGIWWT
jgi:1,4-dihydroxy-2-naphthoate octaprenyltransferase